MLYNSKLGRLLLTVEIGKLFMELMQRKDSEHEKVTYSLGLAIAAARLKKAIYCNCSRVHKKEGQRKHCFREGLLSL